MASNGMLHERQAKTLMNHKYVTNGFHHLLAAAVSTVRVNTHFRCGTSHDYHDVKISH